MSQHRPASCAQLKNSLELILRKADNAQQNGRPDEVSSLVDMVYAILDRGCEPLH